MFCLFSMLDAYPIHCALSGRYPLKEGCPSSTRSSDLMGTVTRSFTLVNTGRCSGRPPVFLFCWVQASINNGTATQVVPNVSPRNWRPRQADHFASGFTHLAEAIRLARGSNPLVESLSQRSLHVWERPVLATIFCGLWEFRR